MSKREMLGSWTQSLATMVDKYWGARSVHDRTTGIDKVLTHLSRAVHAMFHSKLRQLWS